MRKRKFLGQKNNAPAADIAATGSQEDTLLYSALKDDETQDTASVVDTLGLLDNDSRTPVQNARQDGMQSSLPAIDNEPNTGPIAQHLAPAQEPAIEDIPVEFEPAKRRLSVAERSAKRKERKLAENKANKPSVLSRLSVIWTLISSLYAIISTCLIIGKNWVSSTMTYILIGILILYFIVFVVFAVVAFDNPKRNKKRVKYYKKTLGIFKAFVNLVFVVLSVTEVVALSQGEGKASKVFFVVLTLLVAIVQLVLKITLLVFKIARAHRYAAYRATVERYVNGVKQKQTWGDRVKQKHLNGD